MGVSCVPAHSRPAAVGGHVRSWHAATGPKPPRCIPLAACLCTKRPLAANKTRLHALRLRADTKLWVALHPRLHYLGQAGERACSDSGCVAHKRQPVGCCRWVRVQRKSAQCTFQPTINLQRGSLRSVPSSLPPTCIVTLLVLAHCHGVGQLGRIPNNLGRLPELQCRRCMLLFLVSDAASSDSCSCAARRERLKRGAAAAQVPRLELDGSLQLAHRLQDEGERLAVSRLPMAIQVDGALQAWLPIIYAAMQFPQPEGAGGGSSQASPAKSTCEKPSMPDAARAASANRPALHRLCAQCSRYSGTSGCRSASKPYLLGSGRPCRKCAVHVQGATGDQCGAEARSRQPFCTPSQGTPIRCGLIILQLVMAVSE